MCNFYSFPCMYWYCCSEWLCTPLSSSEILYILKWFVQMSLSPLSISRFPSQKLIPCSSSCLCYFLWMSFALLFALYIALLREGNGTPQWYSCLENPMDGGAWWAAVHGVTKSQTRLTFTFTFTFHFHAMEKEMATHSNILAWRIPGTREPGQLPSMGSHWVGHDWSDLAA